MFATGYFFCRPAHFFTMAEKHGRNNMEYTFSTSIDSAVIEQTHTVNTVHEFAQLIKITDPPDALDLEKQEQEANIHLFKPFDSSQLTPEIYEYEQEDSTGGIYTKQGICVNTPRGRVDLKYPRRDGNFVKKIDPTAPGHTQRCLTRCNNIVESTSFLKIDIDGQHTASVFERVHDVLKDMNCTHIMYMPILQYPR